MKKFKFLAIALMFGTMSLFANTINNPEVSKDEIRKQIVELVESSNANLSTEAYVDLTFTFSTEGEIVVLQVNSADREVLSFIRENLNYKKIENPGKVNRKYTMSITIKK